MIELTDSSVLVALIDLNHLNHRKAVVWMQEARRTGWATCAITEGAAIRIIGNSTYTNSTATFAEVAESLHKLKRDNLTTHHFWSDSISPADPEHFRLTDIRGHNQLTDLYLLGLCKHHGGKLVTFDTRIEASLPGLVDAPVDLVRILK